MGSCMSSSGLSSGNTVHRNVPPPPVMPTPRSYDLPAGWICQYDPQSQRLFYINQMTGQRQWEHPRGPMAGANDASAFQNQMSRYQQDLSTYQRQFGGGYPPMSQPSNAYYGNTNYGNTNQARYGYNNGYNNGVSGGMGRGGRSGMGNMAVGGAMGGAAGLLAGTLIGSQLGNHEEVNNYYIDQNTNYYDQNANGGGGDFGDSGAYFDQGGGGGDFLMDSGGDAGFFDQSGGDSVW